MPNPRPFPPVIRFRHTLAFREVLREIGAPTERYLRHAGLPTLSEDPDALVRVEKMWSFFYIAASLEDPMLGPTVGNRVGYQCLGSALTHRLESAPTLISALRTLSGLVSSEASDLQLGIKRREKDILFFTYYRGRRLAPGYAVSQAYQLTVYQKLAQFFLGPHWQPEEVGLEVPHIPPGLAEYFPEARLLARQEFGYIAIPRSCLWQKRGALYSVENGESDPISIDDYDYPGLLRSLLQSYIPEGYPSQTFAAELADTSVRTMTRRLSKFGLTYGKLIDDVRFQVATELLQDQDLQIAEIAQNVGFNDQGNFDRMFRRLGGVSPKEYRNQFQQLH